MYADALVEPASGAPGAAAATTKGGPKRVTPGIYTYMF